ncbi:MAG: hypothetical protein IIW65_00175 [Alistipes sp.]|nr:hypothetical protein [Alistipes sp.]
MIQRVSTLFSFILFAIWAGGIVAGAAMGIAAGIECSNQCPDKPRNDSYEY